MSAIDEQRHPGPRPRRLLLGVGAAVVVLVAAAGGAALTWGRPAAGARPAPAGAASHRVPPTTTTVPPDPNVSVVAYAKVPSLAVFPAPDAPAPSTQLSNPNSVGAPLVLLVQARQGAWDQVQLPQRPNESTGWVRDSDVNLYRDNMKIVVHLGAHTIDLYKEGVVVDHQPVIDGSPSSPTPTGSFYITELLKAPDPNGAYGPFAFGLAAFSDTYSEFEGGPGQIAIHGTNQPWLMGQSASHGCVRLFNSALVQLVNVVPVGTPVYIDALHTPRRVPYAPAPPPGGAPAPPAAVAHLPAVRSPPRPGSSRSRRSAGAGPRGSGRGSRRTAPPGGRAAPYRRRRCGA